MRSASALRGNIRIRKLRNNVMLGLTALCTVVVLAPLFLIFYYLVRQGLASLSWAFFTKLPQPPGSVARGGMGNAVVGTIELIGLAILIGVPIGLAGGVYVAEFATEQLTSAVRFSADVLNGIPTIVTGMFVYGLVVVPMHRFSAFAGSIALAIVLIPVVLRASDEVLRTVPKSYREAAMALGATRWRVTWDVVLKAAQAGIVGGAVLGVARIAGETAPLLFTSLNNSFWSTRMDQPIASLTVQIFTYATSAYDEWHAQAWAGALTLIVMILMLSSAARWWVSRTKKAMQ